MVSKLINTRTCLRCQFREVLCRTQRHYTPQPSCRRIASSRQLCQDTSDDLLKQKKPYYWKRFNEGERVVGRPGKWQRVVSKGLSATSLGKPANVIVFRDFQEEPSNALPDQQFETLSDAQQNDSPSETSLSAQDIEHAIAARHAAPRDDEVHASIDALRPDETIQSQRAFHTLQHSLTKSYTFPQLSRYLVRSLRDTKSAIKSKNVQQLETSQWQPGQTPLQQRRSLAVKKRSKATRKSALVDQILRLVWHITIHSEAQEVGELEIKVQPWQLSMLFDLVDNGKPFYESLIGSRILLEACELHSWAADSTLRITGRRHDAEEIARQLKLALLGGSRLDLDLKMFMPLIMKDAHRDSLSKMLSNDNIRHVSELTKTVLEVGENGVIHIYGLQESARSNARRLLVALLGLPGLCSHTETFSMPGEEIGRGGGSQARSLSTIPAVNQSTGLHRRYNELKLGRLTTQVGASAVCTEDSADQYDSRNLGGTVAQVSEHPPVSIEPFAKALSSRLDQLPKPSPGPPYARHHHSSYWRDQSRVDDWEAEYCTILSEYSARDTTIKPESKKNKHNTTSQPESTNATLKAVIQRTVPGVDTLLSYFDTTHTHRVLHQTPGLDGSEHDYHRAPRSNFDPRMPYLSAHFVPFTSRTPTATLPRLEMRFRLLPAPADQSGGRKLLLTKIKAVLDTQTIMVPLPHCSGDMRFLRQASLLVDTRAARQDNFIRGFVQKLQDSVDASEGALNAPPEVNIKLPHWLVHGGEGATPPQRDTEVPYLFERFEQTQRMVFTAPESQASSTVVDKEAQTALEALSESMALNYHEVEGGAMYGRSTSLSICVGQPTIGRTPRATNAQSPEPILTAGDPHVDTAEMTASSSDSTTESNAQLEQTSSNDEASHELSQSTSDAEHVEDLSQKTSTSLELATAALHFANLLTRASSGSLPRRGQRQ